MTPSRVRRVVVVLGWSAAVAILLQHTAPSRANERPAPRQPWVQFDSIRVTNPVFSPNGDEIKDDVTFTLSFEQSTYVFAHVSPKGLPDTLEVLFDDDSPANNIQFSFSWDGTASNGVLQPEGDYTVHFAALTPDSTRLFNERAVRIDLTAPVAEILDVQPPVYAPETLHPDVTPEIRIRVSQSQLEDSVVVGIAGVSASDSLPLSGGFVGDGDYLVLCEACTEGTFPDGGYIITASARDAAGNESSDAFAFDKNTDGPEFDVELPRRPAPNQDPNGRVHFQFADSLVGRAQDRQPVDSVVAAIPFPPDTTRVALSRQPDTLLTVFRFSHDLSQLLAAEGVYDMLLRAYDADGVVGEEPVSVVIDRTRPAPPQITPRPPPQTKLDTLNFMVSVDPNAIRRVIVKGGLSVRPPVAGQPVPDSLPADVPVFLWQRVLEVGSNLMSFESMDYARNISAADQVTVVRETSVGLAVPERFFTGQSIQVNVGDQEAQRVSVRILALDGNLVRTFEDTSSQTIYRFPWDLTTPEGRAVKNGAYLLWVQVRYPDGRTNRFRKMIAVVR